MSSNTVFTAASGKEWIMGSDAPFTIIGERINPTGRKILAEEMKAGDFSRVESDALAQVKAGAHMLDVNAGIPLADEPALLAKAIQMVQALCPDTPICIDSSIHAALEAGLAVCKGRPLLNSVTGETEALEVVLPLAKKYDCAVVAISNDETGISEDPAVRFAVAKKIIEHAADYGIKPHDIVIDPLVMPIGALGQAGRQVFDILHKIRTELGANTTCGASNISFGLPNRNAVNAHFLAMAASHGMTSAIMNPTHEPEAQAITAANMLMGNDSDCTQWIQAYREPPKEGAVGERGRRVTRRRRPS